MLRDEIDIKVKEPDFKALMKGRTVYLPPRFMTCNQAIDEMVDVLGQGIANICYVVNPEVVVLGGGIMAQEEFLRAKIESAVENYLVSSIAKHTKIAFASHRNDAGMLGAFYHFCQCQGIKTEK